MFISHKSHCYWNLSRPSGLLTSIVAVLVLFVPSPHCLELKCGEDHDCSQLPDASDPSVLKHIRCGACQLAATQLSFELMRQESAKGRKLAESESSTLLEGYCESKIGEYGLHLDERGNPLPRFTTNASENRATGGWVKRTLVASCHDVLSEVGFPGSSVTNRPRLPLFRAQSCFLSVAYFTKAMATTIQI
jgi:hypothetical protein